MQAQDLLIPTHFHNEYGFDLFDFLHGIQSFPFDVNIDMNCNFIFETMVNAIILHSYRISYVYELLLCQELGDWVKARSTTWYSQFLLTQYEDKSWIEHFQVNRTFVRQLPKRLKWKMQKHDTNYKCIVLVNIRIACALYKLTHASEYLQCSDFFAIGKSTIHLVLRKFV
jgi:hypothetical protein